MLEGESVTLDTEIGRWTPPWPRPCYWCGASGEWVWTYYGNAICENCGGWLGE